MLAGEWQAWVAAHKDVIRLVGSYEEVLFYFESVPVRSVWSMSDR